MTDGVTDTLESRGVPSEAAGDAARGVAEAVTGTADDQRFSGGGAVADTVRESMSAIRMDFAEANQRVFYGMAIALGIGFLGALRHPGGTQRSEETSDDSRARR